MRVGLYIEETKDAAETERKRKKIESCRRVGGELGDDERRKRRRRRRRRK